MARPDPDGALVDVRPAGRDRIATYLLFGATALFVAFGLGWVAWGPDDVFGWSMAGVGVLFALAGLLAMRVERQPFSLEIGRRGIARPAPEAQSFRVPWAQVRRVGLLVDDSRAVDLVLEFDAPDAILKHPGLAHYRKVRSEDTIYMVSLFHRTDQVDALDEALRRHAGARYVGVGRGTPGNRRPARS